MSNSIRIFATGGTFDKEYDYIHGTLNFSATKLPGMLRQGRSTLDVKLRTLMMKDSLEFTDKERDMIVRACMDCEENKILITHGTDTMSITARYLAKHIQSKTIVLTGAMIPYAFGTSDGFFNLGAAMAFVQTLPPDIYVAMNGRYFRWDNVRKNKETGLFEELNK
ncbi:MAG: asparaginase domain-containing protein [Bacteroidia bacterium]